MAKRARRTGGPAKKASQRRGGQAAPAAQGSLPELSTLIDVPTFHQLKASDRQHAAFEAQARALCDSGDASAEELTLGCVVRLDRGFPAVAYDGGLVRAEFAVRLSKDKDSRAAVGDWVVLRMPHGHDMARIEHILPRESDVARWRGGGRGEHQTLAANVTLTIVTYACGDGGIPAATLARPVVIARDCGTDVAIVLTKADRMAHEALVGEVRNLQEVLGDGVRIVVTSSLLEGAGEGLPRSLREELDAIGVAHGTDAVRSLVGEGVVAIVLGESGAGKSTLINALLGHDLLETGEVRAADDAGRHTTVARRMVSLPTGGVIVDEPGLRTLLLVGHERGLAKAFPEVAELSQTCKFRDCTHTHEPGCSVMAARDAGEVATARVDVYVALANEMRESALALDPDVVL